MGWGGVEPGGLEVLDEEFGCVVGFQLVGEPAEVVAGLGGAGGFAGRILALGGRGVQLLLQVGVEQIGLAADGLPLVGDDEHCQEEGGAG